MQFRSCFLLLQFAFLFLLLNPFMLLLLPTAFNSYDLQRLCQLVIFLILSIQLICDIPLQQHTLAFFIRLKTYKKVLIGIFFLLGLLSALFAKMPQFALLEVVSFFLLMIMAFTFAGYCMLLKEQFIRRFILAMLICFSINNLTALWAYLYFQEYLIQPMTQFNFNFILNFLASPGYMNRRFFDDVLVFVIPLLIYFFIKKPALRWQQIFIFLLLSFIFARGILSGSRIYFYQPAVIFLLFPVLFGKKSFPFLKLQFAVVFTGGLLYFLLYQIGLGYSWQALHVIANPVNMHLKLQSVGLLNLDGRNLLWHIALSLAQVHLLLGAGPLHYGLYAYAIEIYAAHPHSALLVFAAEWGLPALLCLVILSTSGLIILINKARQETDQDISNLHMAMIAALIGGFLMMSIDGLILMPAGQTLFVIIIGLCLFYFAPPDQKDTVLISSKFFERAFIALMILAMLSVCWGVFPYLSASPDIADQYLANCNNTCTLSPNYWSEGFIQFY